MVIGGYNVLIVSQSRDSRCAGEHRNDWRRGCWRARVTLPNHGTSRNDSSEPRTANQRNWRRHCAKSVTPNPAKLWQWSGYHADVAKPVCPRKVEVFRRATAPYPEIGSHRDKKQVENAAKRANCVDENFSSAPVQRFQHDYMVPKQPPKLGGIWRYRLCAIASPSREALAPARFFFATPFSLLS